MKLSKRRHANQLAVNMTPMIDVTFLLIIFFVTVNQVSRVNRSEVELPKLSGTQDQTEGSLTINIDRQGEIVVSGSTVPLPALATLVAGELARADNDPSRVTVVVRADRRGDCRTLNQVVALLARLDITRVRLAVEKSS
jgi:biopolymer transport protein ExbD